MRRLHRPFSILVVITIFAVTLEGQINVGAKGSITANSEPNYRVLRNGDFAESYEVSGLTLKRDVATFTLKSGRVSFLAPVLGKVAASSRAKVNSRSPRCSTSIKTTSR